MNECEDRPALPYKAQRGMIMDSTSTGLPVCVPKKLDCAKIFYLVNIHVCSDNSASKEQCISSTSDTAFTGQELGVDVCI
jgi:hypothetical protein